MISPYQISALLLITLPSPTSQPHILRHPRLIWACTLHNLSPVNTCKYTRKELSLFAGQPYVDRREEYKRVCACHSRCSWHRVHIQYITVYCNHHVFARHFILYKFSCSSCHITQFLFHYYFYIIHAMRDKILPCSDTSLKLSTHAYRLTSSGVGPTGSSDAARLH